MIAESRPRDDRVAPPGCPFASIDRRPLPEAGPDPGPAGLHRDAVETLEATARLKSDDFLVHRQLAREFEALGNLEGARQQRVIYLQKYDAALQTKAN